MQRVLALTEAGRQEVRSPQSGLSLPQRWLLVRIDGQSSLDDLAAMATVSGPSDRLPRDAARLVAMGLAFDVGEPGPSSFGPSTLYGDVTLALPLGEEERGRSAHQAPASAPSRQASPSLWLAVAGLLVGAAGLGLWALQRVPAGPAAVAGSGAAAPALPSALTPALMAASAALAQAVATPLVVRPLEPLPAVPAAASAVAGQAAGPTPRGPAAPQAAAPAAPATVAPPTRQVTSTATSLPQPSPSADGADVYRAPAVVASPPAAAAASVPAAVVPSEVRPAPAEATPARRGGPGTEAPGGTAALYLPPTAAAPTAPAPTPVAAAGPLPRSGSTALRPLSTVTPEYPRTALREGQAEDVVLKARLTVGPGGEVRQVDFGAVGLRERPFLRAARDAMLQWRFPEGTAERSYSTDVVFKREP
jgi:hypothetical protein